MRPDGSNNRNPDVIGRVYGAETEPAPAPELAAVQAQLDYLAAADAASAPRTMSDRVFEASRAGIKSSRPAVVARIGRASSKRRLVTPLRAAAALALAVSAVLVVIAGRGGPRPGVELQVAALERDVNEWLALSNGMVGDLAMQIDGLDADSASLREQFVDGVPATDLFMDEGAF